MADTSTSSTLSKKWAPRFFTIWSGQALSLVGTALVQFALVWWLTQETGSATILATATLAVLLPQIFLGPFIGALVDRWNRRMIMIVADSAIALATLGLAALFALDMIQIWHIYAIAVLRSIGSAFHFPAMQASTSLMVPGKHLTRIAGMNQTLSGAINILAPPTGAVLLGVLPIQGVLLIDVGTALLAVLSLLFFTIPQPGRAEKKTEGSNYLRDLQAGFQYIVSWSGLTTILVMATMINFFLQPSNLLMPLLVKKHFGLGALQFGLLDAAWGFGVIGGGLLLTVWGGFKRKIATSMTGIVGIGLGIIIVGVAPANAFWIAVVAMAFVGVMNSMTNSPLFALVQTIIRPDMQGRVISLIQSAVMAMTPLSLLVAGPVADWLGIRIWYWIGGALSLLMGVTGFFIPAVMNIEKQRNTPKLVSKIE